MPVPGDCVIFSTLLVAWQSGFVLVYNFNGELLNSIEDASLESVTEMTSIDSGGGRIVVLSRASVASFRVYQFSEQGNVLSRHDIFSFALSRCYDYLFPLSLDDDISFLIEQLQFHGISNCHFRFLHKTEQLVELDFSNEYLFLYNKDGMVVREIKLKLSPFHDLDALKPKFIVTTQGLVAVLATEKGTGKRMIVIL